MADAKLDDIITANPLDGTERVYVVQDITGTPHDRKTTTADIAALASSTPTAPGGTDGQVQVNASGSFGGFTVGGDGTLDTSTGALTVTKTNGTSFGSLATVTPTGTPDGTKFLRDDNSWAVPAGGSGSPGGTSGQYQYNNGGSFGGIGMILFADTTFYADASGSTGNTGLSSGSPWPLQYTLDQMAFVDANGYGVTIQAVDGSFAAASAGNHCASVLYRPRNASFFKIYGNLTTPANVVLDGVDGTPYGFLFGLNQATGSKAKVIVDEFGGFYVKNALAHSSLYTGANIGNIVNSRSEDNHKGVEIHEYSTVGDVEMTYAGNHGILLESDTGIINSFTPTFETGATCDDTVYVAAVYGYLGCGNQDYTNLDASAALAYWVDNFGFLDAGGNVAGIPGGTPGDTAPFGATN